MKQNNENKKSYPNIEITEDVPNRAHTAMKNQAGMKSNQQSQNKQTNNAKNSKGQDCK